MEVWCTKRTSCKAQHAHEPMTAKAIKDMRSMKETSDSESACFLLRIAFGFRALEPSLDVQISSKMDSGGRVVASLV